MDRGAGVRTRAWDADTGRGGVALPRVTVARLRRDTVEPATEGTLAAQTEWNQPSPVDCPHPSRPAETSGESVPLPGDYFLVCAADELRKMNTFSFQNAQLYLSKCIR